jgi:hypothetical protein
MSVVPQIARHYILSRSSWFWGLSVVSSVRVIVFKIIDMLDAARCKDVSCLRWSIGKRILQQVVDALTNGFDVLAAYFSGFGVLDKSCCHFNLFVPDEFRCSR